MFCDLVGSTALSSRLDPEEYREVVRVYQETCTSAIRRYDGYIAQHLGDGLLVYFGYPVAHENDAQRAVRTGLEILTALRTRGLPPLSAQVLQVRIGIHTGLVVIGEIGSSEKREILALGEAPNIAARLQGLAEPNTAVISAVTQRLVAGLFESQDLGPQTLKGISSSLSVYQVKRESAAQSRFEVAVRKGLTPLVGREEELGLLRRRWEQAKTGAGQVVLLSGEPGIGKSRLMQTFKEHVMAEGATRIEFRCLPYHQNSAFYSIIEHLQRLLQFEPEDSSQTKLTKLQQALAAYRFPQADTLPLVATLLSLPQPEGAIQLTLSPQKQKQKTQEALVAWMVEEAEKVAVYCAWEDLHWIDPSSLDVLTLVLDQIPTAPLLMLLTFRPEFIPPWGNRSHLSQLTLSRLERSQVERMVKQVAGGKDLPVEALQQIVAKTDGVPLFVEELTKMVVESGLLREADGHYELTGPLPPLAIPATLQDSLMARLDRLATAREVIQLGATLGREFSYELLRAVALHDEDTLQQALAQLVEAEVVYQHGVPPRATYLFKHALIQDVAYQSLLKSKRQHYHQQIAHVLEARFADTVEAQPELLAHHYTEAGLIAQAIPSWQQAGQQAAQRSAPLEATSHLTKALQILKTLPATPEHVQQELSLQMALGASLQAIKGQANPEVERAYARAQELCQEVGATPQLFPVLWGLYRFYFARADLQRAHEFAAQLMPLAQARQDPALLMEAHRGLVGPEFFGGELTAARGHCEQALRLYNPQQHRAHAFLYGQEPGAVCLSFLAWALWLLGYPDQASQRMYEALNVAHELSHPLSVAFTLISAAALHQLRREGQAAHERAEAAVTLSTEQGYPLWLWFGTVLQGWALAEQGRAEEGSARIRQGVAAFRVTGAALQQSHFLALLAEACGKAGQAEEGRAALAEALRGVDRSGERFYEAELYRLKGELTLQQSGVRSTEAEAEAEGYFLKAIEIARQQQAKSLELRAVMSLSRLWQQQGKKEEAHGLLAEIYGWFTEGFDTKDLQEAKALLEQLT
jgi:class 3 adenylate cyclase/predicted ATPase